jgi:hypothetical protein
MSFLGDALQPQPHPQPPPIRILVFTGRGTGGSSARRVKLIAEARGAQVQFGDVAAIVALSRETTDLLVLPGGSAVQQINAFGEVPSSRSFRGFFAHSTFEGPDGCASIVRFVESGGGCIGFCAGAQVMSSDLRLIDAPWNTRLAKIHPELRGHVLGKCKSSLNDSETVELVWHNGPFWAPPHDLPRTVVALCVVDDFRAASAAHAKKKISCFARRACIVKQGRRVACGPHPECTLGCEDFTWRLMMLCLE